MVKTETYEDLVRYIDDTRISATVLQCLETQGLGHVATRLANIRDAARYLRGAVE